MSEFFAKKSHCWQELIQQACEGDDVALGQIVSRVQNYLLFVANGSLHQKIRSKISASDIVQQSMLEAHQSINRFNGSSEEEIRAWLKRIVLGNLVDSTRRYKGTIRRNADREISIERLAVPLAQPNSQTGSWYVSRNEIQEQLLKEVNRLPERQRYVVEARHRLGKSYQEIASSMEITEVAVRKLWSRGVQRLKEVMGEK